MTTWHFQISKNGHWVASMYVTSENYDRTKVLFDDKIKEIGLTDFTSGCKEYPTNLIEETVVYKEHVLT